MDHHAETSSRPGPSAPSERDPISATLTAAGLGALACLGAGLGRDDGAEPWLANGAALALIAAGLAHGGLRAASARAALASVASAAAPWRVRAAGFALVALALAAVHALAWLPFGARLWPLGLATGAAAAASIVASARELSSRAEAPRWSEAPTTLLLLALSGSGGLLALSAIENLLGFPPGLVVWKAAVALIGAGLAAQLWAAKAAEASQAAAAAGRLRGPLLEGAAFAAARSKSRALWGTAAGLGLGLPILCAVAADFLAGGFWMAAAFASHLAGVAALRLLLLAQAERADPRA